jgi:hypothetical protein
MNIDWSQFKPLASLAGGFVIALATALFVHGKFLAGAERSR